MNKNVKVINIFTIFESLKIKVSNTIFYKKIIKN